MIFSIIVPFHNEEEYIERCIESLLNQDFDRNEYEIIFIDDGSTDGSPGIAHRYPRINLLRTKKKGAYAARNAGLAVAKGEVAVFTDGDCRAAPDWLRQIHAGMQKSSAGIALGYRTFPPGSSPLLRMLGDYENTKTDIVFSEYDSKYFFAYANNMAVKTSLIKKHGAFPERARGGDGEFLHKCRSNDPSLIIKYLPGMKITHLEIGSLWDWLKKIYIYGATGVTNTDAALHRNLDFKKKFHIFSRCIEKHCYKSLKSIVFLLLISLGDVFFKAGMVAGTAINLFTSKTARHLSLVFSGNIFGMMLGFLSIIIISRSLSVNDFGLFNIAVAVILVVPPLIDFGMNSSMTKFASFYLGGNEPGKASEVFRITLSVKCTLSFIFALIIFTQADFISLKVFHYPALVPLIKLSAIGACAASIFNYLKSALCAYRMFDKFVLLQILTDTVKLIAIVIIALFLNMTSFRAVLVFSLVPLLGAVAGLGQTWSHLAGERIQLKNIIGRIFSFSKWMLISNICAQSFPYIGIFMLAGMMNSEAAGIYGLALNLTHIFPIIIYSLISVLLPEVSRYRETKQLENYLRGSLKFSLVLAVALSPVLFFSRSIILFIFGTRYNNSVAVFNWLLLSTIVFTVMVNVRIALISMNLPRILAMTDIMKTGAMVLGCFIIIPYIGVLAPAILSLILNAVLLLVLSVYVFKHIRSKAVVNFV